MIKTWHFSDMSPLSSIDFIKQLVKQMTQTKLAQLILVWSVTAATSTFMESASSAWCAQTMTSA